MYVAKPCKTDDAFEITPKKPMKVDTVKTAEKASKLGYEILINTPHVCILKKEKEVSIFSSGRLMIKQTKSDADAKRIAEELYKIIGR